METTVNGSQPIFTIPVEVLCRIFSECIVGDYRPKKSKWAVFADYNSCNPLTLGHICSSWRMISNGFPSLWSKIYLSDFRPRHMDMLKTWLERSQAHELTINLRAQDADTAPTLLEVVRLFSQHAMRWNELNLELPSVLLPALNQILLEAPQPINLKTAKFDLDKSFSATPWAYNNDYSDVWSYLYSSPSLRSVLWRNIRATQKNVPFHQITELEIRFGIATIDIVFDLLLNCINLEHLTISRIGAHPKPPPPIQLILPSLHDIYITSDVSVEPLLSRLIVPSLKSLDIGFLMAEMVLDGPKTVLDLLNRSQCQLSSFVIMDSGLTNELLRQYLLIPQLSSLIKLDISGPVCTPTLKLLSQMSENSLLIMPELEELILSFCDEVMDGTIEELVRSRWRNVYDCSADRKKGTFFFIEEREEVIGPMDRAFLSKMRAERMYWG